MCLNKSCILKEKCHRFTATPSQYRQAYNLFSGPTIYDPEKKCEHYMKPYEKNTRED